MQELYRSDLLQALGWAIADSLWQMSLLWLIYQLFISIPFRQKPSVKHFGAVLMLLIGTGWFFYSFFARFADEKMLGRSMADKSPELSFSFTNMLNSTLPYFSTAYLFIIVLLFARLIYHFISTQRLKMELKPVVEWQHVVNRLTVSLGISREIFIYISEHISVPSTIGYLRPVILLPIATVNQLSVEQLEAVIIHEMAHIRRNDYLVNLIVSFIEIILFFNPFAHLLGRTIRKECELCCDDEVVRQQDPEAYAQALLLLERSKLRPALAMAATGKHGMLLGRVKRILNLPDQEVKYRHKVLAMVLLAGMIMLTGLLTPSGVSQQDREKTTVIAQQVAMKETDRVPLPFIMKISTKQKPSQEKTFVKSLKNKPPFSKLTENSIVKETDFEFVYMPDAPPAPAAPVPPTPLDKVITSEGLYFHLPLTPSEDLTWVSGAPDPRDRRHPDILMNNKIKITTDLAYSPRYYQSIKNKALPFEDLEKPEGAVAKVRTHPEQFFQEQEFNTMIENLKTTQEEKVKPRVQVEIKKQPQKKATASLIRTMPVDKGMIITIIQDEAQIEITVKDKQ
jgi:beta-lactamase regulating signal transducer with metallopeptidase domain